MANPKRRLRVIAVGDTHFPWVDRAKLKTVLETIRKVQPDAVVQMGDLYDFYSFSRYPRSLDVTTPKDEAKKGRKQAVEFWQAVQAAAPRAKCYQLLGNHDDRVLKLAINKAPELASLLNGGVDERLDVGHLWRFPGVTTQPDSRTELVLDGVVYMHGYRSRLGDHMRYNQQSTVVGHSHKGGVIYERNVKGPIFELNAGYLAHERSPVMAYTQQRKCDRVPGYGVIDENGARFIPLG